MNTIRRTISTQDGRNHLELIFEGEKGKFHLAIERYNPYEGYSRNKIALDPKDAEILHKSLTNFLK